MKVNRRNLIRLGALLMMLVLLLPLLPQGQAASLYTVKSTSSATLAPGITQKIHTATYPNDSRTVKYYVATADINRSDVMVLNGYKDNKPLYNSYVSATVDKQILASEKVHQDPADPRYIENYRVVAACNGGFFNIPSISGIEGVSGAHVMEGVQYWPYDGRPFFAILKDGSAVVGAGNSDWNKYREHMWEAISGNVLLVNKGANNTDNVDEDKAFVGQESSKLGTGRHPRTCVGITKDGKVVMMVIDAQATASSATRGGATLNEAAQMLIDAGCYYAINMDGGGSSTYMTKAEGETEPKLINVPSDSGKMRAISGSLLFASVAPTDHLSFEFDGTGSQRYMREMYSKRNYDLASYWATGLAGSLTLKNYNVVMDNTAGTMTVNLNDRDDNSHSTYLAPGAKDGNFNEAEATTSTAFTYVPANAEVLRIRLKFKDAQRANTSTAPFVGLSYLPSDTRTWSGVILKANIPLEYIDGGAKEEQYVTLEIDLTDHKIRQCPSIVSMMLQIGHLRKGTATIDTIYMGPKSGDRLLFGFGEYANDRNDFNDPAYGYLDFNREYHWYKGGELSSMDINHGVLTMKVDNSPENPNNAYVETSLSSAKSVHPLRFTPQTGDILQVRYKVISYDKTLNQELYGTDTVPTLTVYGYDGRQNVYKNPSAEQMDVTQSGYVIKEWTIPSAWTTYDMSKVRLTIRQFVNSTIEIDSIYIGPKSGAPKNDRIQIGFGNKDGDRVRYTSDIYGGMNMDKAGNWSVGNEYNLPVITGGYMKLTPTATNTGYGYVHSGSLIGAYPMSYKPNGDDYLQIRFKITNGQASNKYADRTGIGRLAFFYGNSSIGTRSSYVYHDFRVADVTDQGWMVITYKLADMKTSGTNMTKLSEVTSISPCFNWIISAEGKTAAFYLDYIYVGPKSELPKPQYTVTFKGAAGETLATQTVHKGDTATYTGATPTKASDATNHYTFKGWDKALTNITANTTITAQFTATAHSYTYAKVDNTNHKATCSCGYSKSEAHGWDSGKVTTAATCTAAGTKTYTCSACKATKTETIAKLGHKYDNGTVTTKPTLTEKGVKTFTCQNDKTHTYTEAVDVLSESLYFHFNNSTAAQTRYRNYVYNFKNFDQATAWRGRTTGWKEGTLSMDTGASTITVKPGVTGYTSIYADSVNFDLNYAPDHADYFQMRFKATGLSGTLGKASIHFYYKTDNTYMVGTPVVFDATYLNAGEYFVATGKLQDEVRALEEVNRVVIHIAGFTATTDTNAEVTYDYAYVGPFDSLPIPAYTVTFKDAAGKTLATQLVTKGYSASYSGATPTKASDGTNHYAFKGWDKALTNITANTTITAQFTATAHSYTYAKVDATNHKATCSCGYSKSEAHGYTYKATTDPTTSATGTLTGTCSKCSQTTTVTLPKLNTTDYTKTVTKAPTCTATGTDKYTWNTTDYGTFAFNVPTKAKGHSEVIDKAVPATCTVAGKTEGKHCSVCNTVLVKQETVAAKGHSCTYTTLDSQTHSVGCQNCDLNETAPHSYENGVCVCGEKEIKEPVEDVTLKLNHSLNLASDISVNLVVPKTLLNGFDMTTVYVESTLETYEGNEKTGTQIIRVEPVDNGYFYYFTLDGLTAVQMNDKISSVLYGTKDGQTYYSPVDEYSIATYAYAQLNKTGIAETLKILCADLLRYGAKAQIFKAYRTDSPADAAMTEEHRVYLSDIEAVTFGNTNRILNDLENAPITCAGKSLNLESKVALKFVFNMGTYTGALSDLSLRISYTDAYGNEKTQTLTDPVPYGQGTGAYVFTLDTLLAAELRSVVSAQIYAGETPVSCTLQYSPDTYGNNKTGALLDLCKALFAYSDSAKAYFA